jgi:hypothetical protein
MSSAPPNAGPSPAPDGGTGELLGEVGDAGGGSRQALIGVAELAGGSLDTIAVDALARVVERAAGAVRA